MDGPTSNYSFRPSSSHYYWMQQCDRRNSLITRFRQRYTGRCLYTTLAKAFASRKFFDKASTAAPERDDPSKLSVNAD